MDLEVSDMIEGEKYMTIGTKREEDLGENGNKKQKNKKKNKQKINKTKQKTAMKVVS